MSRDPKRIPKILKALEKIWKKHPGYRLGQLIHVIEISEKDAFFCEDEELIVKLKKFLG